MRLVIKLRAHAVEFGWEASANLNLGFGRAAIRWQDLRQDIDLVCECQQALDPAACRDKPRLDGEASNDIVG